MVALKWGEPRGFSSENSGGIKQEQVSSCIASRDKEAVIYCSAGFQGPEAGEHSQLSAITAGYLLPASISLPAQPHWDLEERHPRKALRTWPTISTKGSLGTAVNAGGEKEVSGLL